jgi:hypothetical protein
LIFNSGRSMPSRSQSLGLRSRPSAAANGREFHVSGPSSPASKQSLRNAPSVSTLAVLRVHAVRVAVGGNSSMISRARAGAHCAESYGAVGGLIRRSRRISQTPRSAGTISDNTSIAADVNFCAEPVAKTATPAGPWLITRGAAAKPLT